MKRGAKVAAGVAALAGLLGYGMSNANAGQCTQEIANLTKQLSASDAGAGPTTGSPGPTTGQQGGQHPATSLMEQETKDRAATPGDVQRQGGLKADASNALQNARKLDAEGNEQACLDAVREARRLSGT